MDDLSEACFYDWCGRCPGCTCNCHDDSADDAAADEDVDEPDDEETDTNDR